MRLSTKLLAATTTCALIFTAPGLGIYQALAQNFTERSNPALVPITSEAAPRPGPSASTLPQDPAKSPVESVRFDVALAPAAPHVSGSMREVPHTSSHRNEGREERNAQLNTEVNCVLCRPPRAGAPDNNTRGQLSSDHVSEGGDPEVPLEPDSRLRGNDGYKSEIRRVELETSDFPRPAPIRGPIKQTIAAVNRHVSSLSEKVRALVSFLKGDTGPVIDGSAFGLQFALEGSGAPFSAMPAPEGRNRRSEFLSHFLNKSNEAPERELFPQTPPSPGSAAPSPQANEPPTPKVSEKESASWLRLYGAFAGAKYLPASWTSPFAKFLLGILHRSEDQETKELAGRLMAKLDPDKFREVVFNPSNHPLALKADEDKNRTSDGKFDSAGTDRNPSPSLPDDPLGFRAEMLTMLDSFKNMLFAQYAFTFVNLKWETDKWRLEKAFADAKNEIASKPGISIKEFQKILRKAVPPDFHVGIEFDSTESASLPFAIRSAFKNGQRHYYIAWVDPASEQTFLFKKGDEITGFGENEKGEMVPIKEAIEALKKTGYVEGTNQALAEMQLTRRKGSIGLEVPNGAVVIRGIRDGKPISQQLAWHYTPDVVEGQASAPLGKLSSAKKKEIIKDFLGTEKIRKLIFKMLSPVYNAEEDADEENPNGLATPKGFLPYLGELAKGGSPEEIKKYLREAALAEMPEELREAAMKELEGSDEDSIFHAYVYLQPSEDKNGKPKRIGFIRIPDYDPDEKEAAVEEFEALTKLFESDPKLKVDGLIIDQTNNPGGEVFYQDGIFTYLAYDKPLVTPKHQMAITAKEVVEAAPMSVMDKIITNDTLAQLLLGPIFGSYIVSKQFAEFLAHWGQFILKEWDRLKGLETGHILTGETHLYGIDRINPSTAVRFTKPIMMLINELDFSGADFGPAILQDNGRAKIFYVGSALKPKTAGAGGLVITIPIPPNRLKIKSFSMTISMGIRPGGNPLEDFGVTADPGFVHQTTEDDMRYDHRDAVKAINKKFREYLNESNPGKS